MAEQKKIIELEMEEAKELPLVDEGDYTAPVSKIETDIEGRYGKMVRIFFDIDGTEVPALASQNLNENTKLYGWAKILLELDSIKVGDKLNLADLKGKEALITVRNRQIKDSDGNSRVDENNKPIMASTVKELRPKK